MVADSLCKIYPSFTKSTVNPPTEFGSVISSNNDVLPELTNLNIFESALPRLVFPVAFAPIKSTTFLYLKFGLPARYSFSIMEFTIFLGYEKLKRKISRAF